MSLLAHHQQMLNDSAISPEVAEARGYRTIQTAAELGRLGFAKTQQNTPALLIPIWGVHGEIVSYHIRPDEPRVIDGKTAKYEFPKGMTMAVDVHPAIREKVRDPSIPLLITEGCRKADAAISLGLCCISIIGTFTWRGTNEYGGKTALSDWEDIALKDQKGKGRIVYLCFDSDCMLKPQVSKALERLVEFLKRRGAQVFIIYLPHGADGSKVGLDDYLASGNSTDDLLSLASKKLRKPAAIELEEASGTYRETEEGFTWNKPTQYGIKPTPLSNFTARITEDIIEDDGLEERRHFRLAIRIGKKGRALMVPASLFAGMNWVPSQLGGEAIVYPGSSTKEHLRVAIQTLSKGFRETVSYAHTGWREVGGEMVYLHAGGAISANGTVPAATSLSGDLRRYVLPEITDDTDIGPAIKASLGIFELGRYEVVVPLLAAVYRSALGSCDFGLHFTGSTGVFKSELAALAQQHFGSAMDSRHLPGSWIGSDNSLEGLAFQTKDALLCVDDFAPVGSRTDNQQLWRKADRLFRGLGNNAGRSRMNADGTLRPTKFPRCLILSTGEDIPPGHSLRARVLIIQITRGDINKERLTELQDRAHEGDFALAMAGFVRWLAQDYPGRAASVQLERREVVAELGSLSHARTPYIIADLLIGLSRFLDFAVEVGALTEGERSRIWESSRIALLTCAGDQAAIHASTDPAVRFFDLLRSAVVSNSAHVAARDGSQPDGAQSWGWWETGIHGHKEPKGKRIGWVEEDDLYLDLDTAVGVASAHASSAGEPFAITARALGVLLVEKMLIASHDPARGQGKVRQIIEGQRRDVVHVRIDKFYPSGQSAVPVEGACAPPASNSTPLFEKPDQPDQLVHENGEGAGDPGQDGQNGHLSRGVGNDIHGRGDAALGDMLAAEELTEGDEQWLTMGSVNS